MKRRIDTEEIIEENNKRRRIDKNATIDITEKDDVTEESSSSSQYKRPSQLTNEVLDIVSQKSGIVTKAIINEEPVDQDIVDAMIDHADNGDVRKMLKLKNDYSFEVKWLVEYESDDEDNKTGLYWCEGKITNIETGKKHRFYENELGIGDHQDVPIVNIRYDDEEEDREVCFLDDHQMYDIKEDVINLWRQVGSDFDESSDDDDEDDNILRITFEDKSKIRPAVEDIIPKFFVSVLEKYTDRFNALPFKVRQEWTALIVTFKIKMCDKLVEYIESNLDEESGRIHVTPEAVNNIIDSIMEELGGDE